jgi:glucose/arabinose dehydrogenase
MRITGYILALVALLATACSSADEADPTTSITTTAPSTAVTTTAAPATTVPTTTASPTTTAPATTTSTTTTTTEPPPQLLGLELELVAEIPRPLVITAPPGDPRVFVAEREGTILVIEPGGEVRPEPFLDITDRVWANGIEQGLLGLAFHPLYADNGRFFVYYTDEDSDTRLVEFTVSADPAFVDPASARELLLIDQPTDRHNAGMLEFGPDGYLYVAVGDGGDGGGNAQKPENVFGTILRLDVESGDPYAIPPDNPFVDGGGAAEVWAYGLRNPWRFSIDAATGLMFIGDVGQESWEEIDVIPLGGGGANLGWAYREGSGCFSSPECEETETVFPVVEYPHSEGCSVTGGIVYRGPAIPELDGVYVYSDWCQGWIRSFRYEDGAASDEKEWSELDPGQVNTFGTDAQGEIYIGTWEGEVWKLVPVRADS